MMKKNKFFSIVLCLALLVSMLPAAAFAAPANDYPFTIIFGTKAYDQMALAKPELAAEIKAAFIANSNKFFWVKADKTIIDNFGAAVDLATLPKNITLKKGDGTQTMINEGEESLQVISISAITPSKWLVKFSGKIKPTKLVAGNFSFLDKKDGTGPRVNNVIPGEAEGKSEATLVLASTLDPKKAPYKLIINKSVGVQPNIIEVPMTADAIVFTEAQVVDGQNVIFKSNIELDTAVPLPADVSIKDLTDEENLSGAITAVKRTKQGITVTVTNGVFFQDGHKYKVIIAAEKLKDTLGNTNEDPYKYEFTAVKQDKKPVITKVTLQKSKVVGQVVALVEFDMGIKRVDPTVKITVYDPKTHTDYVGAAMTTIEPDTDADSEIDGLNPVPYNQLVIQDITALTPVLPLNNQKYIFKFGAGEVAGNDLAQLKNDEQSIEIDGLDLTAPKLDGGSLNADGSITLKFNEKVTYKNTGVQVDGFAGSTAQKVQASVVMSADGMEATLTPTHPRQIFATGADAEVVFALGAFVDEEGNKIAAHGAVVAGMKDNMPAKAIEAKTDAAKKKVTITFTEKVKASDKSPHGEVTLDDTNTFEYAGAIADEKWTVDAGSGKVEVQSNLAIMLEGHGLKFEDNDLQDKDVPTNLIKGFYIEIE